MSVFPPANGLAHGHLAVPAWRPTATSALRYGSQRWGRSSIPREVWSEGPNSCSRPSQHPAFSPSACIDERAKRQSMLTTMELSGQLAQDVSSTDSDVGLRAVAALRALNEQLERLQVDDARAMGWSWQEIATRLGVTKQTVHRKHRRRMGKP